MFKFDNMLICLDLTDMDEALISYTNFAVDTFKPKRLTFIHVMDSYDIPDELADDLEHDHRPLDEMIREEIEEKVNAVFAKQDMIKPEIVLETGLTTEKIIQFARKNKTDLAIMGKKVGYVGQGAVVRNIVGLIPSSVLLISETTPYQIEKVLVRTNFAKPSFVAWNMAKEIAGYTNAEIEFHHVYKLPYNYFPEQSPQAQQKLKKKISPYIEKQFKKFVSKYKITDNPGFDFSLNMKDDEAQSLYNYAVRNNIDLLITGTRLKSKLANILLDSTSEKLAGAGKNIPVLIVKDTKESVGFLKALFD